MSDEPIPSGDLRRQYTHIQQELEQAVLGVLRRGWYILGNEVRGFETAFAEWCGAGDCVGVANGTDALALALAAVGIGPGDEVITVANACTYQALAIRQVGAVPVFADIDPDTLTLDPGACEDAITPRTRAVLPVHLAGRMADMPALCAIASRHGLAVVEDAAQAHGAWMHDEQGHPKRAGTWGDCGCFSFYPSKNLGAAGDGGAVITSDPRLAEQLRRLRQYGWEEKYVTGTAGGRNSRLDEVQAAVLRVKLAHLDTWNAARRERAAWYTSLLDGVAHIQVPQDVPGHVYHLYVVCIEQQRDNLREYLTRAGIGNDVHYPVPAHMQPQAAGSESRPQGAGTLPHTERLARQVLSLPIFPELRRDEVERVAAALKQWVSATTASFQPVL